MANVSVFILNYFPLSASDDAVHDPLPLGHSSVSFSPFPSTIIPSPSSGNFGWADIDFFVGKLPFPHLALLNVRLECIVSSSWESISSTASVTIQLLTLAGERNVTYLPWIKGIF